MIPLVDLKAQYRSIKPEIQQAIERVLESARYVLGPEVAAFEQEFAAYCGVRHAIGVNSGTSALHLALLAAGVGPGDEVITVPFTFVATAAAIVYTGATPVFVDIDTAFHTMDPAQVERAITPRTKVILPVHLYGQPADMDPILDLASRHGLAVIEDAAQAHGAEYKGRRAGGMGLIGCFSFYPGKNLGAYGEGGAITTDDAAIARRLYMLRDWGTEQKYHHELLGYNYRLEEIQAAILRVKLRRLEAWTDARRSRAALYDDLLAGSPVATPQQRPDSRHVYHIYAVRTSRREALQSALERAGVHTGIHYPVPVHLQPPFLAFANGVGSFPNAERAAREVLSLPMFAELTADELRSVVDGVEAAETAVSAAV